MRVGLSNVHSGKIAGAIMPLNCPDACRSSFRRVMISAAGFGHGSMKKHLAIFLLLMAIPNAPVRGGLDVDKSTPSPAAPAPEATKPCEQVSFTRNLRYGDSDLNVLDVATGGSDTRQMSPRPVLLFVAGESFSGDNTAPTSDPLQDAALCFAARNGMVGVKMNYRLAPANPWPSGARDVAAATSWVHQNIDLFGGSRDEIVAIGYSVGAFHVASLLAHPEFQDRDATVAAAVLVSGIYRESADASPAEKPISAVTPASTRRDRRFPAS